MRGRAGCLLVEPTGARAGVSVVTLHRPVRRAFSKLFEQRLFSHEIRPHVTLDEERVCNDTEQAQRRSPGERVAHDHRSAIHDELVHVPKAGKWATDHLIDELARPIELDDFDRQPLPDSEVHALQRDDVTEIQQSGGLATDSPFASERGRLEMHLDIAGKVEAQLDGGGDSSFDDDRGHRSRPNCTAVRRSLPHGVASRHSKSVKPELSAR